MERPVRTIADILALKSPGAPGIHEWSAWAVLHIISAATLSRLAGEIEISGDRNDKRLIEHRALVTGAILISVTFLEAAINELFAEAKANPFANVRQLDPSIIDRLAAQVSDAFMRKVQFLSKYQRALRLAGKPSFNQGKEPYSEVNDLRRLRVELQHLPPEWRYAGTFGPNPDPNPPKNWLAGKFPRSGMAPDIKSENLHAYLGHGCAKWAVESSIAFTDDFYRRLAIIPPYDTLRADLNAG
jgi:hypothetical protein